MVLHPSGGWSWLKDHTGWLSQPSTNSFKSQIWKASLDTSKLQHRSFPFWCQRRNRKLHCDGRKGRSELAHGKLHSHSSAARRSSMLVKTPRLPFSIFHHIPDTPTKMLFTSAVWNDFKTQTLRPLRETRAKPQKSAHRKEKPQQGNAILLQQNAQIGQLYSLRKKEANSAAINAFMGKNKVRN